MSTTSPRGRSGVTIRALERDDLQLAARLHRQMLPHGIFPALGDRFLRRYLLTYATSPAAVAFVAEFGGVPVGFLVGVLDPPTHRCHMLRQHGIALVGVGLPALVLRPRVAFRFVRTRAWRYVTTLMRFASARVRLPVAEPGGPGSPAVLCHVAVVPDGRGSGIGASLVATFEARARNGGVKEAVLLTLADGGGAGPFYERLGWHAGDTRSDRDGISWRRYRKDLG
jgi:GNAT superfamily N-acetyltransferase